MMSNRLFLLWKTLIAFLHVTRYDAYIIREKAAFKPESAPLKKHLVNHKKLFIEPDSATNPSIHCCDPLEVN